MNNRALGRAGEDRAAVYLKLHMYKIIARNFNAPTGEIDIIAKKGNTYVFVEVKYRSSAKMGMPGEAVNYRKQERIRKTALWFMVKNNIPYDADIRFDVIEILGKELEHLKAVF